MPDVVYQLTVPPQQAFQTITQHFSTAGWQVTPTPQGFTIERGNMTKTVFLGAFAGNSFHVKMSVDLFPDPVGTVVVFHGPSGAAAVKGGIIGYNKSTDAHRWEAYSLAQVLSQTGILRSCNLPPTGASATQAPAQPGYGALPPGQAAPQQAQPGYGTPPPGQPAPQQAQPGYGTPPPGQPAPQQTQPGYGTPPPGY